MMTVLINIKNLFIQYVFEWKHIYCTPKHTQCSCVNEKNLKITRVLLQLKDGHASHCRLSRCASSSAHQQCVLLVVVGGQS